MNRYEELCQAYVASRNNYLQYHQSGLEFSGQLLTGLAANFQIPEDRVRVIPGDQPAEAGKEYTLAEVMKLGPDAFWHFGLEITLCERPDLCLQQVLIRFRIKKTDSCFTVLLGDRSEEEFSIDPEKGEDFQNLFDYVFTFVKNLFEHGLEEFLEKPRPDHQHEKPRKIGF
ncbi:MAG: hypothetical protein ACE5ER_06550 [Nitrospinaceae bacterium]